RLPPPSTAVRKSDGSLPLPLRLQPSLTHQPVRFEAFVVLLKCRLGLAIRYRLSRRHRIESPSIGFVRDLLLDGSLRFHHLLFHPSARAATAAHRQPRVRKSVSRGWDFTRLSTDLAPRAETYLV